MTPLDRGIAIFGTQQALAKAADCYPQEISRWKLTGWVPENRREKLVTVINAAIPDALKRKKRPVGRDVARPISTTDFDVPVIATAIALTNQ